jgi:hypothetical protein
MPGRIHDASTSAQPPAHIQPLRPANIIKGNYVVVTSVELVGPDGLLERHATQRWHSDEASAKLAVIAALEGLYDPDGTIGELLVPGKDKLVVAPASVAETIPLTGEAPAEPPEPFDFGRPI